MSDQVHYNGSRFCTYRGRKSCPFTITDAISAAVGSPFCGEPGPDLETKTPICSRCGSHDLKRLVARVAMLHSEDSHLENLADPSAFGDLDENDPKSVARMMRKMSREAGEDLGPEFGEVVDRLESGQSPEDIESAMPGLGGEGGGAGDMEVM